MKIKQIYIASPFFSEQQSNEVEAIKQVLKTLDIKFYSPKDEKLFKPGDSEAKAKETFESNIIAMDTSDLMIANIEGWDPGTIFELGYFYATNKPVIAYSSFPGRKLNLMLSHSCIAFANGSDELSKILIRYSAGDLIKESFKGEHV